MNKKRPLALNKDQIGLIRKLCAQSERHGSLTPALLKIVYEEKWFKLFLPKNYGGLGLSLPEALKYEEQLAYIDGSLGWTVTLCAGANLFAGYIRNKKAPAIFSSSKVCFGGSGATGGVATKVKDGYMVTGHWHYATGAPHLTHFTANCTIEESGQPVLNGDGTPIVRSFFFKRKDVVIHEDWNTMGLIATAGHSFSVSRLKVPFDQSFVIDEHHTALDDLIYRYPFLPLAESTIAVNTLGMATRFIELAREIIEQRQPKIGEKAYQLAIARASAAQQLIQQLAERLYQQVDASWAELSEKGAISRKCTGGIANISRKLVAACRKEVTDIYPYCGLGGTGSASEINRAFRDIFTASQHGLLSFPR